MSVAKLGMVQAINTALDEAMAGGCERFSAGGGYCRRAGRGSAQMHQGALHEVRTGAGALDADLRAGDHLGGGGGAGFSTGGQHADMLEARFAHTAGMKVVAPSNPADAKGLLLSCIFDDDPCIFLESLPLYWTSGAAPPAGVGLKSEK